MVVDCGVPLINRLSSGRANCLIDTLGRRCDASAISLRAATLAGSGWQSTSRRGTVSIHVDQRISACRTQPIYLFAVNRFYHQVWEDDRLQG